MFFSHNKERIKSKGVWQQVKEENIRTKEGKSKKVMDNITV
jgi:hypothetical protein